MGVAYGAFAALANIVLGLPYARGDHRRRGPAPAIPFFGPFLSWLPPVVVALLLKPEAVAADADPHGHRLVRDDEHPPAAADVGRRGHPPDRRPGVGAHRLEDRRHHRARSSASRSPRWSRRSSSTSSRGSREGGTVADPGGPARRRARGPGRPQAARAGARRRRGRRRGRGAPSSRTPRRAAASTRPTTRPRDAGAGTPPRRRAGRATGERRRARRRRPAPPDMTRERARTERRDLDQERGEPVAAASAGRPAVAPAVARPLGDWTTRPRILVTNDDGIESRGLLALKQALDPIGDVTVVAPDTNQCAVGHQKTLMRPLRVRERTLADGSIGWSVDGSPTDAVSLAFLGYFEARLRPRRVGHQLRREPGRRHHLLGHGSRRRWRRSSTAARRSRSRRSTTSIPTSRWPRSPRRWSPATSSSTASRAASCSTSTCRRSRPRSARASRSPALGKRVYQDELIRAARPARHPLLLDRRPATVRARDAGHRLPRGRQPADRGHARSTSTSPGAPC